MEIGGRTRDTLAGVAGLSGNSRAVVGVLKVRVAAYGRRPRTCARHVAELKEFASLWASLKEDIRAETPATLSHTKLL